MKLTLKELLGLVTCVAAACGSIAWYTRIPPGDPLNRFFCLVPLIFILLTTTIASLAIFVAAVSRKRSSRDMPERAPLPRRS